MRLNAPATAEWATAFLLDVGRRAGAGIGRAIDLVLPPLALDDAERPQSPGLSVRSWERIRFIDGPVCDGCGAPFAHSMGVSALCAACLATTRSVGRARAACLYDEHSRDLILKLKHADRTDLAPLFARWLSRSAADLLGEADAICPVPLHPRRLLSRRYNQAAEIARPLARQWKVAYRPDLLSRTRSTPTQGGRSGRARRENVRGAFAVPTRNHDAVKGRRILLIDDVLTTGATGEACAGALMKAGAAAVDLAVVARVHEHGTQTI